MLWPAGIQMLKQLLSESTLGKAQFVSALLRVIIHVNDMAREYAMILYLLLAYPKNLSTSRTREALIRWVQLTQKAPPNLLAASSMVFSVMVPVLRSCPSAAPLLHWQIGSKLSPIVLVA